MDGARTVPVDLQSAEATNTLATQSGKESSSPSAPPEILAGYRRLRLLGAGGMGDVYLAEQLQLHRQVALKVLRPGSNAAFISRFLREAKTMAAVTHPNVVAIHDAGEVDGFLYMALELVTGGDLAKLIKMRGTITEQEALRMMIACCRGMEAIESAGLIHRDIKPANIFLTRDGIPKIGDLGLARHADGEDRMTLTGHSWGTPAYMSPEQVRGEADIDIRSDIYALGATLYCLLTGHPPFRGATSYVITNSVLTQPPPDVREANRTVQPAVAAIIRTTLAKDRRQRHPTPAALRVDCERALERMPLAFAAVPDAPLAEPLPTIPVTVTGAGRDGGGLPTMNPLMVKLLAYGSGVVVLGLVAWSLTGETHVERRAKGTEVTSTTPAAVRVSAAWMSTEGRDDLGSWAEVRRPGFHLRFRWLPAGTYLMGSPPGEPGRGASETLHEVTLSKARWVGESEVTHRTWQAVMGQGYQGDPDMPVAGVSWYEVREFLSRLRDDGIPARLPTEAEWEQAARGGGEGPYGGALPDPREWLGQPAAAGPRIADPATANRYGLLDMGGNLREWVEDTWDAQQPLVSHAVTDPCERFGGLQVVRGGSWDTPPAQARCAARMALDPQKRDPRTGFRLVIGP